MPLVATLIAGRGADLDPATVARAGSATGASDPVWLAPVRAADLALPAAAVKAEVEAILYETLAGLPVDIVVQQTGGRRKKMLIADMDSTMIDQECIDELADEVGMKAHVAAITARAMNGEIEFEPALRERVALLGGLDEAVIDRVIEQRITLASGGKTLLATMKAHGAWTALVSGGFEHFTSRIGAMLGFDENRANRLVAQDGRLAGTVAEPILGREAKAVALREIAARLGIGERDVIAVGDGANDLDMLSIAGSGVALHAKPAVAGRADIRIDHADLTALLYIQGYREDEFSR